MTREHPEHVEVMHDNCPVTRRYLGFVVAAILAGVHLLVSDTISRVCLPRTRPQVSSSFPRQARRTSTQMLDRTLYCTLVGPKKA